MPLTNDEKPIHFVRQACLAIMRHMTMAARDRSDKTAWTYITEDDPKTELSLRYGQDQKNRK